MGLREYSKKRDFSKTKEPKAKKEKEKKPIYVIQKHHASRLHYDFRLAINGVLKSWAVPKGVPKKIGDKSLAIQTEDHPMKYASFEGVIPKGEYGAGKVEIWDKGIFHNLKRGKTGKTLSLATCLRRGQLELWLEGDRLHGPYALIHFKEKNWLLVKMRKDKAKDLLEKK